MQTKFDSGWTLLTASGEIVGHRRHTPYHEDAPSEDHEEPYTPPDDPGLPACPASHMAPEATALLGARPFQRRLWRTHRYANWCHRPANR